MSNLEISIARHPAPWSKPQWERGGRRHSSSAASGNQGWPGASARCSWEFSVLRRLLMLRRQFWTLRFMLDFRNSIFLTTQFLQFGTSYNRLSSVFMFFTQTNSRNYIKNLLLLAMSQESATAKFNKLHSQWTTVFRISEMYKCTDTRAYWPTIQNPTI